MAGKTSVDEVWAKLKASSVPAPPKGHQQQSKPPNFDKLWFGFLNDVDPAQQKQEQGVRTTSATTSSVQQQLSGVQITQVGVEHQTGAGQAAGVTGSSSSPPMNATDMETIGHLLQRSIAQLKDSAASTRRKALSDIKVRKAACTVHHLHAYGR